MTYSTYFKEQFSDFEEDGPINKTLIHGTVRSMVKRDVFRYTEPPKKIPMFLPKPSFTPSRLVRVSDMKVMRGSEVNEGYCTLSYSWSQSGELVTNKATGKTDRIDQGMHRIVKSSTMVQGSSIPPKVQFVKFEGLIQEICEDFNVKYIWYDQMCIDQNNNEEKHREIRHMHKIYQNAYCTVVLVPELTICHDHLHGTPERPVFWIDYDSINMSQWMKRAWTLEETLMSSKMLFIGKSVHTWWYQISPRDFPIFRKNGTFDVATILHYAHARTSSKEHDHVFALANSIPEVIKAITIDYDQDVEDLMIRFYGILAEKDIRILCFGPHDYYKYMCATPFTGIESEDYIVPIQKFNLPSWTGVEGEHIYDFSYRTSFKNYAISGRTMQIKCTGITNDSHNTSISSFPSITPADLPPIPLSVYHDCTSSDILVAPVQLRDCSNGTSIWVYCELVTWSDKISQLLVNRCMGNLTLGKNDVDKAIKTFSMLAHFLPIRKEDMLWVSENNVPVIKFDVTYLAEHLNASSHYTLLTGVQFKNFEKPGPHAAYPVIKKNGDYYKAIGLCKVYGEVGHLSQCTTSKEQIYEIQ